MQNRTHLKSDHISAIIIANIDPSIKFNYWLRFLTSDQSQLPEVVIKLPEHRKFSTILPS